LLWDRTFAGGQGGIATFGGVDESHYKGKITYAPVRRKGYWEVELEKFRFGDEEMELDGTGAAIDTGTSLIAVPSDIAEIINKEIGATKGYGGQYTLPCDKVPSLPQIGFTFAGKEFKLAGEDYTLNVQGQCISAFTGLDIVSARPLCSAAAIADLLTPSHITFPPLLFRSPRPPVRFVSASVLSKCTSHAIRKLTSILL
jgi:hypothetical protein